MGVPTAISVARTNGASVTISWIHIPINDGSTNAVCFMIFNQALTTSTFTDTNTVALTQADHGKWVKTMCGTPAVTPGLSGVSELDFDNLNIPIVPGVASQSIYIGEYSNATQTPGTSPNTTVNIGLAQN
jgi:hypothetical protein